MKLDALFFAAHPDDVELACSGTILSLTKKGKKVGVIDLTQGELGTRGSVEIRAEEAQRASEILGLSVRGNLKLRDGFFDLSEETLEQVIAVIREFEPDILVSNAISDRHPDHGRAAALLDRAFFMSGLSKVLTQDETGADLKPWRAKHHYHYIQNDYIEPDFVVDVTEYWEERMQSVYAYSSQFYDPKSDEEQTFISSKRFIEFVEARARELGNKIGVEFGEGFVSTKKLGVRDITRFI